MSSIRGVNVGGNLFDVTDSSNVAPIQLTNFASRPYAKDRCFIMADGLLYRATAEIENGDPIVINGNCRRTTLDEIISVIETDSDLIAPTEDGATSSDEYVVGDEIVRSGILYNVISAIAEGDAFVVGNNIDIAGSLTSQIKTLANNDNAMLNVLGAKNLLPNDATTQVINGVTFTVNNDGSVTVSTSSSGATVNTSFDLSSRNLENMGLKVGENYTLSGCPSGGSNSTFVLNIPNFGTDTGSGVTSSVNSSNINQKCRIIVFQGTIITTPITFKPMIRPAEVADDTFVPYVMTNRKLTKLAGNKFGTRVSMGLGAVGTTYTCPNDGLIWFGPATTATERLTIMINGIPRVQMPAPTGGQSNFQSMIVFNGDIVGVSSGTAASSYFYPRV